MLTPWKKSNDKPRQHIKKQRHSLAKKGPSGQSYGFSIIMYRCESWTIKKAECWRIDAFKLWCWRRLLKVPWRARRSNQSILREINPEYSLEGLMLKMKVQYFGHLMWTDSSLEKSLMLGKIEGRRKRGHHRMRQLYEREHGQALGDDERQGGLECCSPWGRKESDTTGWLHNNNTYFKWEKT